jgi:Uma2 family endonuclease
MSRVKEPVTAEQFVALVQNGQKADLLDGVIYLASPDSPETAEVNVFLTALLDCFVRKFGLGKIYGPRSAFRLSRTYAPEPDIAFVRADRLHLWKGSIFQGAPDVAVEIVAPDSVERDTTTKRATYEEAGVSEYWLVNLIERRCVFLRLEEGKYREATLESGSIFRSQAIPRFWLDTAWLLADETPPPDECLSKMLES